MRSSPSAKLRFWRWSRRPRDRKAGPRFHRRSAGGARPRDASPRARRQGRPGRGLEARCLVEAACGFDRAGLVAQGDLPLEKAASRLAEPRGTPFCRRAARSHSRRREFWGLTFQLSAATLVPRPEDSRPSSRRYFAIVRRRSGKPFLAHPRPWDGERLHRRLASDGVAARPAARCRPVHRRPDDREGQCAPPPNNRPRALPRERLGEADSRLL